MQDSFTVVLNGSARECTDKKKEITNAASEEHMKRSEFMLWLFEEYKRHKTIKS